MTFILVYFSLLPSQLDQNCWDDLPLHISYQMAITVFSAVNFCASNARCQQDTCYCPFYGPLCGFYMQMFVTSSPVQKVNTLRLQCLKASSKQRFFCAHYLLQRSLGLLSGTDVSLCHKKPFFIKHFKAHILQLLKCLRTIYLSRVYLNRQIGLLLLTWFLTLKTYAGG